MAVEGVSGLPLLKGFQVLRRRSSFNCKKMYIWIMNLFQ